MLITGRVAGRIALPGRTRTRRNWQGALATLLALATLVASPAAALSDATELTPTTPPPTAETGHMVDETAGKWFIELASPPVADGGKLTTLRAEKDNFRAAARAAGVPLRERYAFDVLWNGLSVELPRSSLPAVWRISGVKALYPVATLELAPHQLLSDPELATALAMTGADVAQSELGLTGAGVRVAIMDTGIDYHHADLGSCFGPGCRVIAGYDFVGDAFNADPTSPTYNPVPVPDLDPDDCNGHGTHVAGIVGASGAVKGVAPGVTFGAYRVFGCGGSTTADIMIAAMERAQSDGMHVLNMSIGSAFQWPQYPTSQASDRLVNKGMVVVASIGNSGANGIYSAGAPGVGSKVIGVASFENSHISALSFNVSPSGRQVPYLKLSTTPDPPTSGTSPAVVSVGRGCLTDPYHANPAGKVALIERGVCTFNEKYQRAAGAGAAGVLIYNSVPGIFAGGGVTPGAIFGVAISREDGLHLRGLASPPTLTWTETRISAPNPTGGLISSFSSYGVAPDLTLKPDIGAPGGLIRSTYPLERGAYAIVSGTSMAAPHVAGAAALVLQAKPNTSSQVMRTLLQNSAKPKVWWGNPGLGFLDNVHRQGAGMLDVDDAILATAKVEPGKLSLGESTGESITRTLTVQNSGPAAVTYTLSHAPALSTSPNTFAPGFPTGFATVSLPASVTVPGRGSASVTVTVTPNSALPNRSLYGGYVVFTPQGGQSLRVPYAGFKGDYQSIQALTPTSSGFPWLAKRVGTGYVKQAAGTTYTLTGADIPYFLVHFDHQVRRVRLEVFDATTGRAWHRAFDFDYVGRNSTSTSFFAFPWDGSTVNGKQVLNVPNGEYVVRVSVQKALGEDDNAQHWEGWTSPPFVINRP